MTNTPTFEPITHDHACPKCGHVETTTFVGDIPKLQRQGTQHTCDKCNKKYKTRPLVLNVGVAYLCPDGLIRWCYHESARHYFHLRWLEWQDDAPAVWYDGGQVKIDRWTGGRPTRRAPSMGETFFLGGSYRINAWKMTEEGEKLHPESLQLTRRFNN